MSLPNNYDPTPLAPQIIISRRGNETFRWQHPQIADEPRQDFNLESWSFRSGINTDAGNCAIAIPDHDLQLAPNEKSPFEPSDMVVISLGKNPANLQKYWAGEIKESRLINGGTNKQKLEISCVGQINELAYRYATVDYTYPDWQTNPSSRITEILKRVMGGGDLLLPDDLDVTYNISDINIRLPHYQHRNRTIKSIIADLAKIGAAVYGLSPDRELFFGIPEQSDFVISSIGDNQVESDCYVHNVAYGSHKSHLKDGFGRVITLGLTALNYLKNYPVGNPVYNMYDVTAHDGYMVFPLGHMPEIFHAIQIVLYLNKRWVGPHPQNASLSRTATYFSSFRIYKTQYSLDHPIPRDAQFIELSTGSTNPPITNFEVFRRGLGLSSDEEFASAWVTLSQPEAWADFWDCLLYTSPSPRDS